MSDTTPDSARTTALPRRHLGRHGPQVGALGFGAMGMSWAYNDPRGERATHPDVIREAVRLGATLIDTADLYGPFTNEDLVGQALVGMRDEVVLATKGGLETTDPATHAVQRDGRPSHLRAAITGSLRRLGTDHVDVYYLHRVDENVPLADQWGTLAGFVQEGKALNLGLSEVTVAQLDEAHAQHPVGCVQSELSLWTRDHLATVVPWCAAHGVAFIAYAPLGRGYLTGSISADTQFPSGDFRAHHPRFSEGARHHNGKYLTALKMVAARHAATPAQVALAWVLAQAENIIPIPGTKSLQRLRENLTAAQLQLTGDDLAELDAIEAPLGTRY